MESDLRFDENLIGAEELAERLGVGVQWVYDQVGLGRIPHFKVGKYLRFRFSEILPLYRVEGDAR